MPRKRQESSAYLADRGVGLFQDLGGASLAFGERDVERLLPGQDEDELAGDPTDQRPVARERRQRHVVRTVELIEAEAAEIRRLVWEKGQREPTIGQAFRPVWAEFIVEPGARPKSDETVGRHLCVLVAAHYGEDASAPPWKRPEEPLPPKPRRGKALRPATDSAE